MQRARSVDGTIVVLERHTDASTAVLFWRWEVNDRIACINLLEKANASLAQGHLTPFAPRTMTPHTWTILVQGITCGYQFMVRTVKDEKILHTKAGILQALGDGIGHCRLGRTAIGDTIHFEQNPFARLKKRLPD